MWESERTPLTFALTEHTGLPPAQFGVPQRQSAMGAVHDTCLPDCVRTMRKWDTYCSGVGGVEADREDKVSVPPPSQAHESVALSTPSPAAIEVGNENAAKVQGWEPRTLPCCGECGGCCDDCGDCGDDGRPLLRRREVGGKSSRPRMSSTYGAMWEGNAVPYGARMMRWSNTALCVNALNAEPLAAVEEPPNLSTPKAVAAWATVMFAWTKSPLVARRVDAPCDSSHDTTVDACARGVR